jgi:predicted RNA methylase
VSNSIGRDWRGYPFNLTCGGDLAGLRRSLEAAGYTEAAISKTIMRDAAGKPLDITAAVRRTASTDPLPTLIRLFMLARAVPEEAAGAALAPARVEDLLALGLLRRCPEGLAAEAALMPSDDLLMAREFWPDFTGLPLAHDYVLGAGPVSRDAAYLTVRRQGDMALDVGTGTGYLALLAARHARHVVATDTNPRALNFAALNARLNELHSVEFRQGSLFEPVADCRFDLIVANPPFVISPKADYEYRDSGQEGDALCEQLIRQAPAMLREGGYCTVVFNWHHQDAEDWAVRPSQWLAGGGCDAWLTCFSTTDPIGYVSNWLDEDFEHDPERSRRMMDQWVGYLERLHIRLLSFGALVLRRRSAGPNWFRAECAPVGQPAQSCSTQIQRIFAAEDLLQKSGSDAELLARRFLLTPDHQLEQLLQAEDNRWVVKEARLKQTQGYSFVGNVDRMVSTLLAGCDGRRTLGEIAEELAAGLGRLPAQVAPASCDVIRTLLRWGFLIAITHPAK